MTQFFKRCISNERGFTLVIVFFVLIIVSIAGISLLSISANTMNGMKNERVDQSVYYIAESALVETNEKLKYAATQAFNTVKHEYEDNLKLPEKHQRSIEYFETCFYNLVKFNLYNDSNNTTCTSSSISDESKTFESFTFEDHFGKTPSATVEVTDENSNDIFNQYGKTFSLQSVGTIDGKSRTLSKEVQVRLSGLTAKPNDEFIFTPSSPVMVTGAIDVSSGGVTIQQGVQLATTLSESENDALANKPCGDKCLYGVELPDFTPLLQFAKENYPTGGNPKKGLTGPLYIEKFRHSDQIKGELTDIIVVKSGDIKINAGAIIDGFLIAPNSNITFVGNSSTTINGAIIAKSFDINNGTIMGTQSSEEIIIPGSGEGEGEPLPGNLNLIVNDNGLSEL